MFDWKSPAEWKRIIRYYQAGVVNMAFGYSLFAAFVALGMDMYAAQIVAHVIGVAFNYFTYSRYAFAGQPGSRARFVVSYAVNYVLSLGALALVALVVPSPYAAGLIATVLVSVINYFVLKRLVFASKPA